MLPMGNTQNVPLKIGPTITTTTLDLEHIISLGEKDTWYFIIVVSPFVIQSLVVLHFVYWALRRRSYVYIDFSTAGESYLIYSKELADANRCFNIVLPGQPAKMRVINCFLFSVLKFESTPWVLEDSRNHRKTELPRHVLIGQRHVKKVAGLFEDSMCNILPVVLHNHECAQKRVQTRTPEQFLNATETSFV